jgi:hypothetical protein
MYNRKLCNNFFDETIYSDNVINERSAKTKIICDPHFITFDKYKVDRIGLFVEYKKESLRILWKCDYVR